MLCCTYTHIRTVRQNHRGVSKLLIWLGLVVTRALSLYHVACSDQRVDALADAREQLEQSRSMVHGLQQEVGAPVEGRAVSAARHVVLVGHMHSCYVVH